ncbi:MAG: hypothetical protein C0523_02290 [Cytophaga sp.]|nr:hypothetical protein [Cytophaga sp.]
MEVQRFYYGMASAWSSSFIVYGILLCASFGCASRFFSNGAGKQDVVFGLLPLIATGLQVMVAGVDDVAHMLWIRRLVVHGWSLNK